MRTYASYGVQEVLRVRDSLHAYAGELGSFYKCALARWGLQGAFRIIEFL